MDANLTLNQLAQANNGARRLIAMIGAKHISYSETDNHVAFRFMRGASNKANYIKITLTDADLYDVEFGKIHGLNYRVISKSDGLYEDMLKEHFESETGLYLTM